MVFPRAVTASIEPGCCSIAPKAVLPSSAFTALVLFLVTIAKIVGKTQEQCLFSYREVGMRVGFIASLDPVFVVHLNGNPIKTLCEEMTYLTVKLQM